MNESELSIRHLTIERLRSTFRPASPVDDERIFAGRQSQLERLRTALATPGRHIIVYGERGVGKTSIAKIALKITSTPKNSRTLGIYLPCTGDETFSNTWKRVFQRLPVDSSATGFKTEAAPLALTYGSAVSYSIDDAVKTLRDASVGRRVFVVIDEFDLVHSDQAHAQHASLVKQLSDEAINATIAFVGVAKNVGDLMKGHVSVERATEQIFMPRMSADEIRDIIDKGLRECDMSIDSIALQLTGAICQGLPHYAHVLGLNGGISAASRDSTLVEKDDIITAMQGAVEQTLESTRQAYNKATGSSMRATLYGQVLLACALAESDDDNFFAPSDVRDPLNRVTKKSYEIYAFLQHLKSFTQEKRGAVLETTQASSRPRYRFSNPGMRIFVLMRGLLDKKIASKDLIRAATGQSS